MRREPGQQECANEDCGRTFTQYNSLQTTCSKRCQDIVKEKKKVGKMRVDLSDTVDVLKANFDIRNVSLPDLKAKAKREAQEYARRRDAEHGCISCPTTYQEPGYWHGGHYLKAETHSGVMLDDMNIHKQCKRCNIDLDGNKEGFRKGLIERHGSEYVTILEERGEATRRYKWDREELIEAAAKYRRLNNFMRNN